jgi:hypothetical protein
VENDLFELKGDAFSLVIIVCRITIDNFLKHFRLPNQLIKLKAMLLQHRVDPMLQQFAAKPFQLHQFKFENRACLCG